MKAKLIHGRVALLVVALVWGGVPSTSAGSLTQEDQDM
jgi:hypothetical protein